MARKNTGEKELRWRAVVKRQAGSGLSVREFCANEGFSQPSFYAWRRKLRERKSDASRTQDANRQDASNPGRLFVPLQLLDATQTLEIIHPRGYRVQIIGEVNPVTLRHVIETLDERGVG